MMQVNGYLVTWADEAALGDGNRERFAPASFANTGAKLTFGHDPRAAASLGHARVTQDAHGAKFVATLDEHDRDARRVLCAVRRGLDSCSFKFKPLASRKAGAVTTIARALLLEISVVSDPCYRAGGVWLVGDEPYLPPRLAALAHQFATAAALPAKPLHPVAAHTSQLVRPVAVPRRVTPNSLQAAVARYMTAYLARAGRGMPLRRGVPR